MERTNGRHPTTTLVPMADALGLGAEVWDGLYARSGARSPFLTWAWHRAWADAVPREQLETCGAVVLRSAAGAVDAVLPFRVRRDRFWRLPLTSVGWAFGDLGAPDHLELLADPAADLETIADVLDVFPWHIVKLDHVAESASNVDRLAAVCARRGWTVRSRVVGRCPYLNLPESWDAYLASLTGHGRRAVRRKERKLRREHDVTLTDYGPGRVDEGLDHLIRLHSRRWSGRGAFRNRAMRHLHRRFAAALAETGRLWLTTLDVDGAPAAAWYGFALGDTVYHYQNGRDPRWERERVGTVLMGLMIRRAIERGYRRMDLLRGEEPYKAEWTETATRNYEVVVFRSGWRGALLRGVDRAARTARTVVRRGT